MTYIEWRFHYYSEQAQMWWFVEPGFLSLNDQIRLSYRLGQRFWIEHWPEGRG